MQLCSAPPTLADLALSGPVLPRLTEAVRIAEVCHRAALARHRIPSPVLAGKDAEGRPLRDQHRHAHYIPDCRGPDPMRVTHILVYAPGGLGPSEVAALARITDLPPHLLGEEADARSQLGVALVALGQPAELRASALCQRHTVFASRTPFILPRHRKPSEEPEDQLCRELRLRGLPAPMRIERTPGPPVAKTPPGWAAFRRSRGARQVTTGFCGFRIELSEPVSGPLLLGRDCHYGLGQFVPPV